LSKELGLFLLSLAIIAPISIVVMAFGGKRILARAFLPIRDVTKMAEDITESRDYTKRVLADYTHSYTETVRLTNVFNNMLSSVQANFEKEKQFNQTKNYFQEIMSSDTETGRRLKELSDTKDATVTVNVNTYGPSNANAVNWDNASNGTGSSSIVNLNIIDTKPYRGETVKKEQSAASVVCFDYANKKTSVF